MPFQMRQHHSLSQVLGSVRLLSPFHRGGVATCHLSNPSMRATAALGRRVPLALAPAEIQSPESRNQNLRI